MDLKEMIEKGRLFERRARRPLAALLALLQTGIFGAVEPARAALAAITTPAARPTVFLIHDVHAQPKAQASIAALIESLRRKAPVGFIGLEGAFEPISVDRLRAWSHRDAARSVVEFLLREKMISGPIEAAVSAEVALPPLFGVDDRNLYQANVDAYRSAAPLTDRNRVALEAAENRVSHEMSAGLSPAVAHLRAAIEAHRTGKASIDEHIAVLQKSGATISGNVQAYLLIRSAEKNSDSLQLKKEKARLTAALSRKLPLRLRGELQRLASDASQGDLRAFHARLASLCTASGIAMTDYPMLETQARAADAAESLDIGRLETDLESLDTEAILASATPAEREILDHDRFVSLSRKLLSFSLSRTEWESYLELKGRETSILPNASSFEKFYVSASARDAALAKRAIELVKETGTGGILVAGGFHASGVSQMLRDANINVKPVYPTFAMEDISGGSDYLQRFLAPVSPIEPLLLARATSLAPNPVEGLALAPYIGTALLEAQIPAAGRTSQQTFDALNGPSNLQARTSDLAPGTVEAVFTSPNGSVDLNLVTEPNPAGGAPRIVRATFRESAVSASSKLLLAGRNAVTTIHQGLTQTVLVLGSAASRPAIRVIGHALPLIVAVALAGCASPSPVSRNLSYSVPTSFTSASNSDAPAASIDGWIASFNDPKLTALVAEAIRNNPDLKVTAARFEAAQAMHVKARSALFPAVSAGMDASRTELFDNQKRPAEVYVEPPPYGVVHDQNLDPGSDRSYRTNQFVPSIALAWEVDVWGRVRSGAKAASADVATLNATNQFARQSLAAQVARSYFVLIESRLQSQQARADIERLTTLQKISQAREEAGVVRRGEVLRIKAEIAVAEDRLQRFQAAEEKSARGIELLVGRYPRAEVDAATEIPKPPAPIATGIPSELLRRRWDIRAAESAAASRTHHVREAWAARFPRFTINLVGSANLGSVGLIDTGYTAGVNMLAPLLDWGNRVSAEWAASADERGAVAQYVGTVNHAFEEAETALSNLHRLESREAILQTAVEARREDFRMEMARLDAGQSSIDTVIELERRLIDAETALISLRSLRLQNRVDVALSLGGDFNGAPVAPAPAFRSSPVEPREIINQPKPAPSVDAPLLPTGGAWFNNPAYLRYAWLETPVVYLAAALIYLGIAIVSPQIALLPATIGGALAAAPAFFVAGHRMGNPTAMFSRPVIALAAAKASIAVLTAAAVAFSPTIGIAALVPAVGVSSITLWHYLIQRNVVALRASAASATAGNAIRFLAADQSDQAATLAAKAINASYGKPIVTPQAMAIAGVEIAAEGRQPSGERIQSILQGAVAAAMPAAADPAITDGVPQNHLSVIILDKGSGPAMTDNAIRRAADQSAREDREVVVVTDNAETFQMAQTALATHPRVKVSLAASAFDEISGLSLAALSNHLSNSGYLNGNPAVNLMARADLPISTDGLDPRSALANAIILLLNRDLQAVAFTVGGLSHIAELARLAAQQA